MVCDRCGRPPKHPKPKNIKSFTCGMCNLLGMVRKQKKGEIERSKYSPEDVKARRKAMRPKLTQRLLAQKLKIHWLRVSEAERGIEVPCQEIADWMEDNDG